MSGWHLRHNAYIATQVRRWEDQIRSPAILWVATTSHLKQSCVIPPIPFSLYFPQLIGLLCHRRGLGLCLRQRSHEDFRWSDRWVGRKWKGEDHVDGSVGMQSTWQVSYTALSMPCLYEEVFMNARRNCINYCIQRLMVMKFPSTNTTAPTHAVDEVACTKHQPRTYTCMAA